MNKHPDKLWVRKDGSHYHVKPCGLIDDDYFEIPYSVLNRHKYKACMCVLAYYRPKNATVYRMFNGIG